MNEHEFILELQERAKEQEKIMNNMPFPDVFSTVSRWFGNHPWRYLIPLAFLVSLLFRGVFGFNYTNFILLIFRTI